MSIQIAVVPVAGLGTRMLPATKSQPKEMLPVGKKPVVQYVVEELEANGIKQILFVTGKNKTSIEEHFDFDHELTRHLRESGKEELLPELEYERLRMQFFFTRQRKPKGLGDAILCAQNFTKEKPFVVALGDSILGLNGSSRAVARLLQVFEKRQPACAIAVEEVDQADVSLYGIVEPAEDAEVFSALDLVEKPEIGKAPSNLAIAGRYVFSPDIYEAIAQTTSGHHGEIQITDAIRLLLRQGRGVLCLRLLPEDRRYDIGNYQRYFRAFVDFAVNDPELGPSLRQYVREKLREDR